MAWGSKEFVAKSNAAADGLIPAIAGFDADGKPILVSPSGATVELTGGTATAAAIAEALASGGVISAAIDAAITAHVAAYQHTPAE